MASRGGPGPAFHAAPPAPPSAGPLAGQKSKRRRPRKHRAVAAAATTMSGEGYAEDEDDDDIPAAAGSFGPVAVRASVAVASSPEEEMHPSFLSDVKFEDIPTICVASMRGMH